MLPLLFIWHLVLILAIWLLAGGMFFFFAVRQSRCKCLWQEGKRILTLSWSKGISEQWQKQHALFHPTLWAIRYRFLHLAWGHSHYNDILWIDLHYVLLKCKAVAVLPSYRLGLKLPQFIKCFLLCNSLPWSRDFSFAMEFPIVPFF